MAPSWVDAHCHFDDDAPDELLVRARAAGVEACVVVGTDEAHSTRALRIASLVDARYPARFATVGLHPHDAVEGTAPIAALLAAHVTATGMPRPPGSVVAVGECGLDYHYDHSPRDVQRAAFAEQIALARTYDLALVVHTREAWDDTFAVLAEVGVPERTIIHCFTGGPAEARRCLEIGAYLSFSGIATFKTAAEIRQAAELCPRDRMLVETDAPFLAPVPHRGSPNEPAWVAVVGEFLADHLGVSPDELADATRANTARAFAATW